MAWLALALYSWLVASAFGILPRPLRLHRVVLGVGRLVAVLCGRPRRPPAPELNVYCRHDDPFPFGRCVCCGSYSLTPEVEGTASCLTCGARRRGRLWSWRPEWLPAEPAPKFMPPHKEG